MSQSTARPTASRSVFRAMWHSQLAIISVVLAVVASSCALYTWGTDQEGQLGNGSGADFTAPVVLDTATDWSGVSIGQQQACGVKSGGGLWCWGSGNANRLYDATLPTTEVPLLADNGSWQSVSGEYFGTCAVTDTAELWCWGDDFGAPSMVGGAVWDSVSVHYHRCAIQTDATLWCWGSNFYGGLGIGNTTGQGSPVQVGSATDWTQVAAGDGHTCAINTATELWCWGKNTDGQIGTGPGGWTNPLPQQVLPATGWDTVELGSDHSCATRTDATLWCWGSNNERQLGNGGTADAYTPVEVGAGTTWNAVSAAHDHTCATTVAAAVWCWGDNEQSELGIGAATDWGFANTLPDGSAASVTAGYDHTCITTLQGQLSCWGIQRFGPLGQLGAAPVSDPTDITPGHVWSDVDAGNDFGCAVDNAAALWCWGVNNWNQLGIGGPGVPETEPVRVGTDNDWRSVRAGSAYACADKTDDTLWCWGYSGPAVGVGDNNGRAVPTEVVGGSQWKSFDILGHACGIQLDNSLWCWGINGNQRLGFTTFGYYSSPVEILAGTSWSSVTTGSSHTCAVKLSGELWCWGKGNAAGGVTEAPMQLGTATNWDYVEAGSEHNCAATTSRQLWCWGVNTDGQLGGDPLNFRSSPRQVGTGSDWYAIGAGGDRTCAITDPATGDNELFCWGKAVGNTPQSDIPVQTGVGIDWYDVDTHDSFMVGAGL